MSDNPTADFLNQAAAAGLNATDLEALAAEGGGPTAGASTPSGTGVTSTDSLGLPEVPSAAGGTSPLVISLPNNPTLAQQESAAMAQYNASPALQQYITQTYGYIGAYLLSVPELLPILVSAGLENWDQAQFDGAIVQTQWWQSTSQAQRNFQEIQATDPGEAANQVAQMQSTILTQAQSLGVTVPPNQIQNLAKMAVTFGWSSDVIQQTLRAGGGFSQATPQFGASATFADQAQQLAGEYIQPMSQSELSAYVNQNVAGTLSADGLQQEFAQKAAQQMPWMASSIQMGVTPSQYLSSYSSAAGQTLEIDPSDVNWSDPKWMQALLTPSKDGSQQPVSVAAFQQNLMKNPLYGYQSTKGARDQAFAAGQQIAQTFGRIAA